MSNAIEVKHEQVDYDDINYTVLSFFDDRFNSKDKDGDKYFSIEFRVYEINGKSLPERKTLFLKKNYVNSMDTTYELSEAQVYLHGFIRNDECSNWMFDEQDNIMLHFCSKHFAENIGVLFGRLYDIAERRMGIY